jgi:hypothetical protein
MAENGKDLSFFIVKLIKEKPRLQKDGAEFYGRVSPYSD